MVSMVHMGSLQAVLPIYFDKVGANQLRDILNTQVGKKKLGCIDIALKTNKRLDMLSLLRYYGAREQRGPEEGWRQGRRSHWGSGVDNSRSHHKSKYEW